MKRLGLIGSIVPLLASAGMCLAQPGAAPLTIETVPPAAAQPLGEPVVALDGAGVDGCATNSANSGPQFWVDAEYMLFWIKQGPLATPLVTSASPDTIGVVPNAGAIGAPGTSVLFGNNSINYGTLSGGRLTAGGWLDSEGTIGFEARGFLLQQASTNSAFASGANGLPNLNVPVNFGPAAAAALGVPAGPNAIGITFPAAVIGGVAFPGTQNSGSIDVTSKTQLWGAELNGLIGAGNLNGIQIGGLVGFRYLDLREDLSLLTSASNGPASTLAYGPIPGSAFSGTVNTADTWTTRNQFYGAQVGAQAQAVVSGFLFGLRATCAFGPTHETVNTGGATTFINNGTFAGGAPAGVTTVPGGLLNVASNFGRQTHDEFSVVPEVEVKVGYAFTENIRAFVGYDFLYWSQVARPGDQINNNSDFRAIPSSAFFTPGLNVGPAPVFSKSDFWAQGVTFGVQLAF